MEGSIVPASRAMATQASGGFFGVLVRKQTYLNCAYLLAGSACGLIDLILVGVTGAVVFGLVFIPLEILAWLPFDLGSVLRIAGVVLGGVLAIPVMALFCYVPAILEQRLARLLLKIDFVITPVWSRGEDFLRESGKYLLSAAAWKRVLFCLLRIPLGAVSFLAMLTILPVLMAVLTMPVLYLAGFHDLIVGPWQMDSLAECLGVSLVALLLTPLLLHASNWVARLSGWFAGALLPDGGGRL